MAVSVFNTAEEVVKLIKEAADKEFDWGVDGHQCNQAADEESAAESYEKSKAWGEKKTQLEREYLNLMIYSK